MFKLSIPCKSQKSDNISPLFFITYYRYDNAKKTLTQNKSNEYVSFSSNIRLEENIILIFFDILLLSIPFIYKMLLLPAQ